MTRRSEDDLRSAFAAKAGDAPQAQDVLRAVHQRQAAHPTARRRWLVPALGAAAAVAIGVPVGFAVAGSNGSGKHLGAVDRGVAQPSNPASPSRTSRLAEGAGSAPALPGGAGSAASVCRPDDVTVTVRRDAAERATVSVTARDGACTLARIPQVRWNTLDARPRATSEPAEPQKSTAFGRLAAGATAAAQLTWDGPCSTPPGDAVTVDWGAGPVPARVTGATRSTCTYGLNAATSLHISAFTGLS